MTFPERMSTPDTVSMAICVISPPCKQNRTLVPPVRNCLSAFYGLQSGEVDLFPVVVVALLTRWTEDVWDANYRGLARHAVILCQPGSVVLN